MLVVPTDRDVDQVAADARFFVTALQGATDAETERLVLPFPSWQVDPYRGMSPHFRVTAARARALQLAAARQAQLVVASAAALLPKVSPAARILQAALDLRSGTEIAPHDLADLLVDAGFAREDPVTEHGSFAVRGGIVDVFPAFDAQPVRIEFVGDMVESLRRFDPESQRSVERPRRGGNRADSRTVRRIRRGRVVPARLLRLARGRLHGVRAGRGT